MLLTKNAEKTPQTPPWKEVLEPCLERRPSVQGENNSGVNILCKSLNYHRQSGIALIVVLWMLALLTVMAGGYSATMRTETILTAHQIHSAQSRALAEAGIWLAVNELMKPRLDRNWKSDGTAYDVELHGDKMQVSIQDESGKIDLNTARVELLHGLLKSAGVNDAQSIELLHAILDWRDRDNLERKAGAEDNRYQLAGLTYGAKDGPFNSIDELRLVMGMTEQIFQQIKSALTIHSHQPGINPTLAPRVSLMALPGAQTDIIDEYLSTRGDSDSASIPGSIPGIDNRFLTRSQDKTLSITSIGRSANSHIRLTAVILFKRNAKPPFSVLSWQEGKPGPGILKNDEPNT
ncbi:MAG: type II secretion system protein GspK [Gammaproteobacteria bacterium]|nr:type II secretion system protein GspK [Gammaproteobacteria bacterium]